MKERSYKSTSRSQRDNEDNFDRHSDKYSHILKEKHYKDVSNSKRDNRKSHKDSVKSRLEKSPDRERSKHSKSSDKISSRRREKDKHENQRKEDIYDESYEELSRKKRKIESELHALDLEEAAAQNNQKVESKSKQHPVKSKEKRMKINDEPVKDEPVRIKEEPSSDDSDARSHNRVSKTHSGDKSKHPAQTSKDSGWGHPSEETKKVEKEKPNFQVSGKLAEDTNVYNGVVIKYNEPSEARKPKRRWRLYPFKGESDLPFIPIHRQSAYLFGRTRSIADIPIDHPSCSKQHAVLQYRLIPYTREDGTKGRRVRPYIIDLESSNGTFVNNKRIDPRCYVELMEKDVVKFGYSSREYVILHEESKDDDYEDFRDSN